MKRVEAVRTLKLLLKNVGAHIVDVRPAFVEHYEFRQGRQRELVPNIVLGHPRAWTRPELTGRGFQFLLGGRVAAVDGDQFKSTLATIAARHPGVKSLVHLETMVPPGGAVEKRIAELQSQGKDREADALFEDNAQPLPTVILYSMDSMPAGLLTLVRQAIPST